MAGHLEVWLLGAHVGTLSQVEGRLGFAYAPGATTPLSQSLPIRSEPFDDRASLPFFSGLLPEGGKRKQIARTLQVSTQNDFALLDSLGGECAGAVTLLEPGQLPHPPDAPREVRWLDHAQLLQVLDEMPLRPMRAGEDGLRLSLAGAQDKLPVVLDADGLRIGLPLNGSPSTHILKPPIAGVGGSVFNEAFCMALAGALKLDVARTQIRAIADGAQQRHYLLVERFDRQAHVTERTNLPTKRLHQEDFCQALGIVSEHKYQNEGGPGLAQAFALVRSATRPSALHTLKLLDFVVFNALTGNHDAHGKNFSLLYTPAGAVLTPLYDALCTAVYPTLTEKMAMKIGSKYKFAEVMARHWEQFALDAGLSPAQVKKRILAIAKRLPDLARATQAAFQSQGTDHPIIDQIVALIDQRCALTIRRLTAHPAEDAPLGTA
ncbi:MAG: type II toxin-antitoxin system HipA family toxin [Simplicispira suum]|uniref:type II toxin-antitoxin system HipA family toxin n=1 Tax=Simplicispira suum TaxID=2109915 RepID=UPI001C6B07B7|nr:type II toxin-antitoxin system HipA family toxin [Simplicispira suum]MBW7834209.1 type II toxin-antitoxin system HipA family toxin [Simplicispira suum]